MSKFESLGKESVVSVSTNKEVPYVLGKTFSVEDIIDAMSNALDDNEGFEPWYKDGFGCKVLIPGQKWQTGKVRFSVEFCPDEPIS